MNHIVIGAGIPFLIGLTIYVLCGGRAGMALLVVLPLAMALCGLWAILPDIPLLLGDVEGYVHAHRSPWINIFFWHGTIDAMEQRIDLAPWNWIVMMSMPIGMLLIAWRELNIREKAKAKMS